MAKHKRHHFAEGQTTARQEIADYMTSPVTSMDAESTIDKAAKLMEEKHIGSLLIEEKGDYVGILTETDLTRKVIGLGLDPKTTKVSAVMTSPIVSLECHEPITDANTFMAQKKVRHLAVTDGGKIVGMLSVKDLVSFFANPRLR